MAAGGWPAGALDVDAHAGPVNIRPHSYPAVAGADLADARAIAHAASVVGGRSGGTHRCCATATASPSTIGDTGQPANMAKIVELSERLAPAAKRQFRSVYAGLRAVLERDRMQVFRKPSAEFDQWVLRTFAGDCVEVLDAPYSAAELSARLERVSADVPYWRAHGIRIGSLSADFIKGVVEIHVLNDVDRARVELPARYGPGVPIEVSKSEDDGRRVW